MRKYIAEWHDTKKCTKSFMMYTHYGFGTTRKPRGKNVSWPQAKRLLDAGAEIRSERLLPNAQYTLYLLTTR